jgi:hypothetical protein
MSSLHQGLKDWLIDLGGSQKTSSGKLYYKSYSGDSNPIDVRMGKRRIHYQPDVVWEHAGATIVIELALEDDWRAIVGEIVLAGLSGRVDKVFVVTDYTDDRVTQVVSMLDETSRNLDWLKWGATHIEVTNLSDAKKKIIKRLGGSHDYVWDY